MPTPSPEHDRPDAAASQEGMSASQINALTNDESAARILIVESESRTRRSLAGLLRRHGYECDPVSRVSEAMGAVAGANYDVAIIGLRLREGSGNDMLRSLQERSPSTKVIMLGEEPMLEDAVTALRLGAIDLISRPLDDQETLSSVATAVRRSRDDQARDLRIRKLQRLCNVLGSGRAAESAQVGKLCDELETTCEELKDHVQTLKLASEFKAMIEQELDIEAVLRASLEYMLRKTGPTNAAIYLPSNHSDFSLGAYVNYDCPKDTADVLLDHLADVLAPEFQELDDVLIMDDDQDLESHLGADANWLSDSRVIVFACRHEDECLAVVTFFRDREKPFDEDLTAQLTAMKDIFAEQLAKVIRVHHRAVVDDDWLGADDADEFGADDFGLAA